MGLKDMMKGKKKDAPPAPAPKETDTPTITASEKEHQPVKPTEEELHLQEVMDDFNKRYNGVFVPTHFPPNSETLTANLLFAIYGELRSLNDKHDKLLTLLESIKGE